MQRRGIPNEWASTLNSRRQSPSCCVSSCWGLKCTEPLSSSEVGVWCRAEIKLGQFVSGGPVRHLVRFNELKFYKDQEWVRIWTTGCFTGIGLRHSATGRALWRALYQTLCGHVYQLERQPRIFFSFTRNGTFLHLSWHLIAFCPLQGHTRGHFIMLWPWLRHFRVHLIASIDKNKHPWGHCNAFCPL